MSEKLKVMLVDDHEVVRQGLRALLEVEDDIDVVTEASTGREAVDMAKTFQLDHGRCSRIRVEADPRS